MCTERSEARDLVREWDAIEDLPERFAVKVAIKTNDDYMLIKVLDLALYKQHEVVKELRFVDYDEVDVLGDVIWDLHEVGVGGVTRNMDPIVGYNIRFEGITSIIAWFDDEDARPNASMALDGGGDEG